MAAARPFASRLLAGAGRAFRRLPIRWRLAGGSAFLTLIILLGFASVVGILTKQRIEEDFNTEVSRAADELQRRIVVLLDSNGGYRATVGVNLKDYAAAENAYYNIVTESNDPLTGSGTRGPLFPPPAFGSTVGNYEGFHTETRELAARLPTGRFVGGYYLQYARRLSDIQPTVRSVQIFLALGVLGGTALALLAGLATARRAMAPITELTAAARRVERTGDTGIAIPRPEADDEVRELARTLEGMLGALDHARGESEAALTRQREFIADASHELRTPLTSVLANLELLEETLEGDQREAAASALRSSRRMRRLVADLLLLARADAGRVARREPIDLSLVVTEAAGELEPVAGDHELQVDAAPGTIVLGSRDELHRLVLNLMENALRHTDPATAVEATVTRDGDLVVLAVEDDGPGIPPELATRVFERFFRASSDRGGSSGLGLSIVRAVAESHGATVALEPPLDGRGARFVVRFPAVSPSRQPQESSAHPA